ncbi:hypothetical protein FGO68_gene16935 [Halteria grandinella]|uniref:Uncharacterized protein n=1 Tax=Halteria grandinella TaxID=5974 RepID=A0A8J8NEK3_HALGN|nr:hypothetical protein FGO68_gene16935 [Halteria grandinella]
MKMNTHFLVQFSRYLYFKKVYISDQKVSLIPQAIKRKQINSQYQLNLRKESDPCIQKIIEILFCIEQCVNYFRN